MQAAVLHWWLARGKVLTPSYIALHAVREVLIQFPFCGYGLCEGISSALHTLACCLILAVPLYSDQQSVLASEARQSYLKERRASPHLCLIDFVHCFDPCLSDLNWSWCQFINLLPLYLLLYPTLFFRDLNSLILQS